MTIIVYACIYEVAHKIMVLLEHSSLVKTTQASFSHRVVGKHNENIGLFS